MAKELSKWDIPNWHPDHGDARREIDMLRAFAMKLEKIDPEASVKLMMAEDGYISLDVFRQNKKLGEVCVVAPTPEDNRLRYGLFLFENDHEDEHYSSNAEEIVEIIHSFSPSH